MVQTHPEMTQEERAFPEKELIVEEYKSLRGEIDPLALMMYPILALFPALIWQSNQVAIVETARYIREQLEPNMDSTFRWEEWLSQQKKEQSWSWVNKLYIWGICGIFIGSQVMVLAVAISLLVGQYEKYKIWVHSMVPTVFLAITEVIAAVIAVFIMWSILTRFSGDVKKGT